jgi:biopolymer transport protein ExbD
VIERVFGHQERAMRKRNVATASAGVALGLIITPMLDMSFQILSFFIMTYHPSALEGHVNGDLALPKPSGPGGQSLDLSVSEPEIEANLQVIVKAVPKGATNEHERVDGQPTQIYVKATEDAAPALVADDGEAVDASMRKLSDRLKRSVAGGMRGNIRLDCQGDLKHQYVMRIFDVCKAAGFDNVAFAAPAVERRKD